MGGTLDLRGPRRHGIDQNVVRRQLHGHGLREVDDRRLGRPIGGATDTASLAALVGRAVPLVGLALALFALAGTLWQAVPILVGLGFCLLLCVAGSNTLIQTAVDNNFRGRVMALFTMAFLGLAPIGSFAVGSLAHAFGVRPTLIACGLCTALAGLVYRRNPGGRH